MSKPIDKFEATRIVVETIKDFQTNEQEMIFRWAAESLGLSPPLAPSAPGPPLAQIGTSASSAGPPVHEAPRSAADRGAAHDIKSFIAAKKPRSDVQFAATVAYYYQFVAAPSDKKIGITRLDLVDACRKVGRTIPPHADMTLNNAYQAGLLDRPEKGVYAVNSVGENLVAMTLPGDGSTIGKKRKAARRPSATGAKGARKKATSKSKA